MCVCVYIYIYIYQLNIYNHLGGDNLATLELIHRVDHLAVVCPQRYHHAPAQPQLAHL